MIERIRKQVLKDFIKDPDYYHDIDISRVKSDDYLIERFVTEYQNEEKATEELIKTLKWKRAFGLHSRTDQFFPKEFYELFEIEMHGTDREGHLLHWESTRNLIKVNDFTHLEQEFTAHRLEKLDNAAGRQGWALVIDVMGSGLANVNLEQWKFKISLLQHYPQGLRRVYIVDLPWILNSVMKFIVAMLPQKQQQNVLFIKREQLKDYVDQSYIPVSMMGDRKERIYPEGIKAMSELRHLAFNEKQIDNYIKRHQLMAKRSKSY